MAKSGGDRKPRVQGKIARLTDEQREKLHSSFRENLTYTQIRAALEREFSVRVAESSLSVYYTNHGVEMFGEKPSAEITGVEAGVFLHIQIRPEIRWIAPAGNDGERK
jgi:hypothetical protein